MLNGCIHNVINLDGDTEVVSVRVSVRSGVRKITLVVQRCI